MRTGLRRGCLESLAAIFILLGFTACAGKTKPLENYVEGQHAHMSEGSAYVQAEFDFWAALYEPTGDDLEHLRAAWIEHGEAFPESKSINEIEKETRKLSQRTVLVALFATEFDQADLKKPANGWAVHPVPFLITELPDSDVVLRTLMPVRNPWARYFLLRYRPQTWESAQEVVVSNRTSKVVLKRRQ